MTEQHMEALQTGQAKRLARAQVRRDVQHMRVTVAAALADPCCDTCRVIAVLSWQHRWTLRQAEGFLAATGICSLFQTAGKLTDRQRMLIARELRTAWTQAA